MQNRNKYPTMLHITLQYICVQELAVLFGKVVLALTLSIYWNIQLFCKKKWVPGYTGKAVLPCSYGLYIYNSKLPHTFWN